MFTICLYHFVLPLLVLYHRKFPIFIYVHNHQFPDYILLDPNILGTDSWLIPQCVFVIDEQPAYRYTQTPLIITGDKQCNFYRKNVAYSKPHFLLFT